MVMHQSLATFSSWACLLVQQPVRNRIKARRCRTDTTLLKPQSREAKREDSERRHFIATESCSGVRQGGGRRDDKKKQAPVVHFEVKSFMVLDSPGVVRDWPSL